MDLEATKLGIILGLPLALAYIVLCCRIKTKAKLEQFLLILVMSVSFANSISVALLTVYGNDVRLGPLANQRLTISLGAMVLAWFSIKRLFAIWSPLMKRWKLSRSNGHGSAL